jgi:transposase-like protein
MAKTPLLQYSPELKAWIAAEVAEQIARYREIVKEMDAIESEREQWIAEFLERIQTRGYNVHADILRVIAPEEIPKRPDRKLQVVF